MNLQNKKLEVLFKRTPSNFFIINNALILINYFVIYIACSDRVIVEFQISEFGLISLPRIPVSDRCVLQFKSSIRGPVFLVKEAAANNFL